MNMRPLALALSAMLSAAVTAPAFAQSASAPAACQYVLGFKALHDLDPSDIGDCVDNQATASNGDAQQHTSKGLMAWRKADNWTAFTNGYMTWLNGPNGLQSRLNTDKFPWEGGATSAAPSAASSSAPASSPAPSTTDSLPGQPTGPAVVSNGPDDSQPLGDAPAGGFYPITLPPGCVAQLVSQPRVDLSDKSTAQPNGRTWVQITPKLTCNGQDTPVSSLPQSTLDAACNDAQTKYQNIGLTGKGGMVLTAKDYLCPKLDDPHFFI